MSALPVPDRPKVRFTVHAVERFVERCAPGTRYPTALALLREAWASSRLITKPGEAPAVFLSEAYACKLVIRRVKHGATCVTVLHQSEGAAMDGEDPTFWAALYHYARDRAQKGDPRARRLMERAVAAGVPEGWGDGA